MSVSRASPVDTRAKATPSARATRQPPTHRSQPEWSPLDPVEVQVEAGQEHEEREPHVRQCGHQAVGMHQLEDVGPHEDPRARARSPPRGRAAPCVCSEMIGASTAATAMRRSVGRAASVTAWLSRPRGFSPEGVWQGPRRGGRLGAGSAPDRPHEADGGARRRVGRRDDGVEAAPGHGGPGEHPCRRVDHHARGQAGRRVVQGLSSQVRERRSEG